MKTFNEWANENNPKEFQEIFQQLKKLISGKSDEKMASKPRRNYQSIVDSINSRNSVNNKKEPTRTLSDEFPGLTKKKHFSQETDDPNPNWIG
jgi:hypothetical protein